MRLGKFRITINEVITVLMAMSAYSTIPALTYVIAELIVYMISRSATSYHPGVADLITRTVVLALAYIVAYLAYNKLGSVESIVGGVCSVSVSLLLPSLFYYKLHKEMSATRKAVVVGMCVFGVVCLIGIASINILELTNVIKV